MLNAEASSTAMETMGRDIGVQNESRYSQKEETMPVGHGVRARTRDLFARPSKIGQCVDVKVNGAIHKGMPHKFYHGRTGVFWNITKRAIGVEMNKEVHNKIIKKRIHVRIEHVQLSRCAEDALLRRKNDDRLKAEAKARGEPPLSTKRQPEGPRRPGKYSFGWCSDVCPWW